MARLTINGRQIDAERGRPLVEVIKESGLYISNLCYIDGLPPYAGCRTCVVEIEGAPGLPLSCTTTVTDGMVVRTDTPAVVQMRQEVMAVILANHSDRCLSCHRVEHCKTGEICLRDNVVTHRCVTCSKNYRCELQTASDLADMGRANVEPFLDEARTYYQGEQPQPDRANPFLEFDPQMCILCARCIRACDDLRHTTAISLAGRGFSTRIAFGAGGTIDESNCDFCGACIDVCPTATLMEAPNKWVARPERWAHTVCVECSVGCTIQMGVRNGRGVIVRPGAGNDVSRDQICVRGRFGYDQVRDKHRLKSARLGRGAAARDAETDAVLDDAAATLHAIVEEHGAEAVGLLGSAVATNEENFLLRRLAEQIGTPNLDSSAGYVDGPVAAALRAAFGSERLPSALTSVERANTVVVVADDLEATHNVAALRVKDAVISNGAVLAVVAAREGALDRHAAAILRPPAGDGPTAVGALLAALLADEEFAARLAGLPGRDALAPPALGSETEGAQPHARQDTEGAQPHARQDVQGATEAADVLRQGLERGGEVAVLFAPPSHGAAAGALTRAVINLTIALAGPEQAPHALHLLPADGNAVGLRDMGVVPGEAGLDVLAMLAAAREGHLRALIIAKDNPLMTLPNTAAVRAALERLDLCLVIDDVATDTIAAATHVLPDVAPYAKAGTITTADRQILRLGAALRSHAGAKPLAEHLVALAARLARRNGDGSRADTGLPGPDPAAVMAEIRATVPGYEGADLTAFVRGTRQPPEGAQPHAPQDTDGAHTGGFVEPLPPPRRGGDGALVLMTARDLYTDREAAAIHLDDADRLHRTEHVQIHPRDAAARGIADGDPVSVSGGGARLTLPARVTDAGPAGAVFISSVWNGGAVQALLPADPVIPLVDVLPQ